MSVELAAERAVEALSPPALLVEVAVAIDVGHTGLAGASETSGTAAVLDRHGLMSDADKCKSNPDFICVQPLTCRTRGCYYTR